MRRMPFLMSSLLGLMALKIRARQPESAQFIALKRNQKLSDYSISEVLKNYRKNLLATLLLSSMLAVGVYMLAVYLPSYLTSQIHLTMHQVMLINVFSFFTASLWTVLVGFLTDRYGAKFFTQLSCMGFILLGYPIFSLLAEKTIFSILFSETLLIFYLGLTAGSLMALLSAYFPPHLKYSGIGMGFNLSMTVFGSLTPLVSLYLTKFMHNSTAPFLCFIFAAVLTWVSTKYLSIEDIEK